MMATNTTALVEEAGVRKPTEVPVDELGVGEVGYLVTGLKDPAQVKVGDTITNATGGCTEPLPGYRDVKPMVYTGLFPIDGDQYEPLKDALESSRSTTLLLSMNRKRRTRLGSASVSVS